jgi:predicted  nucleic acid-binding Zn-ribbon protein
VDQYNSVIDALHQSIAQYQANLEILQSKFQDIGSIISQLDDLKQDIIKTQTNVDQVFTSVKQVSNENDEIRKLYVETTAKVTDSVSFFKTEADRWSDKLNENSVAVLGKINQLQTDFIQQIEKTFNEIVQKTDAGIVKMDGYFSQVRSNIKSDLDSYLKSQASLIDALSKTVIAELSSLKTKQSEAQLDGFKNKEALSQQVSTKTTELQQQIISQTQDVIKTISDVIQKSDYATDQQHKLIKDHQTELISALNKTLTAEFVEIKKRESSILAELNKRFYQALGAIAFGSVVICVVSYLIK